MILLKYFKKTIFSLRKNFLHFATHKIFFSINWLDYLRHLTAFAALQLTEFPLNLPFSSSPSTIACKWLQMIQSRSQVLAIFTFYEYTTCSMEKSEIKIIFTMIPFVVVIKKFFPHTPLPPSPPTISAVWN